MRSQGYFKVFVFCLGLLCAVIISHNSANAQARRYEVQCSEKLWNASFDSVLTQIGLVELTGNNDGKHVEKYLKSVGLKGRLPYCYAGQYWAFYVAADNSQVPPSLLRTGLAAAAFNNAVQRGVKTTPIPQPKDLVFWKFSQKVNGHAARITKIKKAGWIETAEFNTPSGNVGNQRDGGGNHIRNRNTKYPLNRMNLSGFIGRNRNEW